MLIAVLLGGLFVLPEEAKASGTSDIDAILKQYGYKNGKYWTYNKKTGSATAYTASDNKTGGDWVGYEWQNGWQCWGFAGFIGYKLFGQKNPYSSWTKYTSVDQVKQHGICVGDIIRIGDNNTGHSAMVYSIDSNGIIKTVECWGSRGNIIQVRGYFSGYEKNNTFDKIVKNYSFTFLLHAPNNNNTPYMFGSEYTKVANLYPIDVICTQRDIKKEPFAAAESVRLLSGSERLTLVASYVNKYGNTWYEVKEGGFVNIDHVASPVASGAAVPTGTLKKGVGFGVGATITSPTTMSKITARVINRATNKEEFTYSVSPNSTTYKFGINSDIDKAMKFRTLTDGYYTYEIIAVNSKGTFTVISNDFITGDPELPFDGDGYPVYHVSNENAYYAFNKNDEVRDIPYEAGNLITSYKKGDWIKVVELVNNKHGNTWMKTDIGTYAWSGDLEKVNLSDFPIKNRKAMTGTYSFNKDDEAREYPYEVSPLASSYKKGSLVNVVASVTNKHDNTWFELSNGTYVFSGDLTKMTDLVPGGQLTAIASPMKADGTFTVTLGIKNNPGFDSIQISSNYTALGVVIVDDGITATGIAAGGQAFNGIDIGLMSGSEKVYTGDGSFMQIKMKAPSQKELTLHFTCEEAAANATVFYVSATQVTVKVSSGLLGDVNGDNKVTMIDAQLIARAALIAGKTWDTYNWASVLPNLKAAANGDLNGDGKISMIDANLAARKALENKN